MEKYRVMLPTSSASSIALSSHVKHVEKEVSISQMKEISSQNQSDKEVKQHRYAFQTRSPVDVLDDGYQWIKYGKKIVKNNIFPRLVSYCYFIF